MCVHMYMSMYVCVCVPSAALVVLKKPTSTLSVLSMYIVLHALNDTLLVTQMKMLTITITLHETALKRQL